MQIICERNIEIKRSGCKKEALRKEVPPFRLNAMELTAPVSNGTMIGKNRDLSEANT